MNLKLKAALSTLALVFFMFVGAAIASVAVETFGYMNVLYVFLASIFAYIVYVCYSIKLTELETLEKLNANRND